ncbi:MAG: hypothetical protein L3K09_01405 [Thermoplasmata archaeon]|nr:hypothetical protein [Thermoplasmata archaeon]
MPAGSPYPSRPLGVAVLAVIIGIVGFLIALAGVLLVVLSAVALAAEPVYTFGAVGAVAALVLLLFGILALVVASGLWNLRQWALVLALLLFGFAFLGNLLAGRLFTLPGILEALLLVYLLAVSRHFT